VRFEGHDGGFGKDAKEGGYFFVESGVGGVGIDFDMLCVKLHKIVKVGIGLFLNNDIPMFYLGSQEKIDNVPFLLEAEMKGVEVFACTQVDAFHKHPLPIKNRHGGHRQVCRR